MLIKKINKQLSSASSRRVTIVKKKLTSFRPLVLTRHPSHNPLRRGLQLLPFRSVVRLGSTTIPNKQRVECNTANGIKNSASKLLMKQCFTSSGIKTAKWWTYRSGEFIRQIGAKVGMNINELPYPIIAKSLHGSRGVGNHKLDTPGALQEWIRGKDLSGYIFEEFVSMSREYRLHITQEGCFYACRKLLRTDAPDETWQRHDDVCTWALETNPSFKKPRNWQSIVNDCIKAQRSLGLDICAFDVMVQGAQDGLERANPEWIICESCSAPSFGEITLQKYLIEIPKILRNKKNADS